VKFEYICDELLNGNEIENCPEDLQVILILEAFPGYTRERLFRESPSFVERMRMYMLAKARQSHKDAT